MGESSAVVRNMLYETLMGWMAQSEKQGFDRGASDKALQTVRNLLSMGFPLEQTAQAVGLSLDEVQQLC